MDTRDILQLAALVVAFSVAVGGLFKFLLAQLDKRFAAQEVLRLAAQTLSDDRLSERFAAQEDARKGAQKVWQKAFEDHLAVERREAESLHKLEKDFLSFKGDLPLHYIRREDYIRNQTIIEAKLDGLALKLENIQLKGNRHD